MLISLLLCIRQFVDVVICSDHKVLPPTAPVTRKCVSDHWIRCRSRRIGTADQNPSSRQGDPRTRARLCSEHLTSGSVSRADRDSPGPCSNYHLASDTSPIAIPISYRRRPPTPTAHHIATHSNKVCPCRRRRQQPYCPLHRVRDAWH
ncbi:hypothetical protein TIFTF001_010449 [Ficus carica]|uniref:Secreted protein n=1 Tax=Ficus carica TaxID=3494 RepID=A0AA87ZX18_FICCA|nr:hypothetical protein TIFTF001_010449 [Ficus carica]